MVVPFLYPVSLADAFLCDYHMRGGSQKMCFFSFPGLRYSRSYSSSAPFQASEV